MAWPARLDVLGTLDDLQATGLVFQATVPVLRAAARTSDSSVTFVSRSAEAAPGRTVCHACALDPSNAFWTLATTWENSSAPVLMALKGTLSKSSHHLDRMCSYRMPYPAAAAPISTFFPALEDKLARAEREQCMLSADERVEAWYHAPTAETIASVFTPNIQILRTAPVPGTQLRTPIVTTLADLQHQTQRPASRKLHTLGSLLDPDHFLSYHQAYEVDVDDDGVAWRSSSIRIRCYDPAQGYRLCRGMILHSERDRMQGRVIRASSSLCGDRVAKRSASGEASTSSAATKLRAI